MKFLWSLPWLRPWLFKRWERRQRQVLAFQREGGNANRPLAVGDAAPEFALPDDTGRRRLSREWVGQGAVLVWLTNLCAVCADQARELSAAVDRGDLRIPVLAVHFPSARSPSPAEFRRQTGCRFPILLDDGRVGRSWAGSAVADT